jgi:hypothetical protein
MSDLQIALIVVGVVLVAAVFAYNKWQEARFRRRAESGLPSPESDILMPLPGPAPALAPRVEPTLAGGAASHQDADPGATSAAAPMASEAVQPGSLSPELDFIVHLDASREISGRALIESALQRLADVHRPVRIEGRTAGGWEVLTHHRSYSAARVGMQLVDRKGRATSRDVAAFVSTVRTAASAAGFDVRPPDADSTEAIAARLDGLCEQVDIQIVVHVVARATSFAGTRIRALAEAAGLVLEDDGRFRRRDENGVEIFSVSNEEATPFSREGMRALSTAAVSLELDIPRAAGGALGLAAFREFAEQFAAGLEGSLVDDNQAPLSKAGFDAIAKQLEPVYATLQEHGIPAGGPLALRLFS